MKHIICTICLLFITVCFVSQAAAAAQKVDDYVIGFGDILEIVTWKEPDFSRENIVVRIDGKITFPLIDDIMAAGQTPAQLKANLEKALKQYIDSPIVSVMLRQAVSQKFYILGEVVRIGEYPLVKKLNVLQAFAIAGGFTQWAQKDEILLFRPQIGKQDHIFRINYKNIIKGKDLEENIMIKANDTIVIP